MRVSMRNSNVPESSPQKKKKPRELINKLNKDITSIQNAVNQYNQREISAAKKQILNLSGKDCPLKTLTEPKYQNLLLDKNFSENPLFLNQTIMGNSSLGKTQMARSNGRFTKNFSLSKRTSLYTNNFSLKRTESFVRDKNTNNSAKDLIRQSKVIVEQDPQEGFITSVQQKRKNVSFQEQVPYYKKALLMSKKPKVNISQKSPGKNQKFSQPPQLQFSRYPNQTIINESSRSVLMKSNMMVSHYKAQNLNDSIIVPFAQQKNLINTQESRELKNSRFLRKKIDEKTQELEKQWAKTQQYKLKYNITQPTMIDENSNLRSTVKVHKKMNKLDTIISKIKDRRPSTTMTQRKNRMPIETQETRRLTQEQETPVDLSYFQFF